MRWRGRQQSENVEDRRGRGRRGLVGGGIGVLVLVLVVALMGGDPSQLLQLIGEGGGGGSTYVETPESRAQAEFVGVVLKDTEDVWNELFRRSGRTYREPRLVLFSGRVKSACGFASAAVGPFYCPPDEQIYIDLSFFDQLERRLGAGGDFARAYVIAHEVGHHDQNLLGISERVDRKRGRVSKKEYNRLSVRLELQADFLAGVWAHHAQRMKQILETGDLEEAINAAEAIGDDRLQKQGQGYVVPDSFTHGTSAQRAAWFRHGFKTGDPSAGDTFDEAVFNRVTPP